MVTDKELLKEVSKELWQSVKKLRPGLPKEARIQLVLKALITIGDLANPIEAAMVVGTSLDLEMEAEGEGSKDGGENSTTPESEKENELQEGRRLIRRRSSTNE